MYAFVHKNIDTFRNWCRN